MIGYSMGYAEKHYTLISVDVFSYVCSISAAVNLIDMFLYQGC